MKTGDILRRLDKHATEYNFPAFDNAYNRIADARLSVFLNLDQWLLLFEMVSWSNRELVFGEDFYAYGNCTTPEGLKAPGRIILTWPEDLPIIDPETNDCIASWDQWAVILEGERHLFRPTLEEYQQAGIKISTPPGPRSISEEKILRFLVFKLGHIFFAPRKDLLKFASACHTKLSLFLQTLEWQHPDVSSGELPSKNISIRTLVEALVHRNPRLFDPGRPNTHWKFWDNSN
jgi:hypothetical protein